jgi:hypothetical protein
MARHSRAMSGRSDGRNGARLAAAAGSAFEMTHSLRLSLPKARWRPKQKAGVLTDALGGALFVLIAGGGWLLIEAATYAGARETAVMAAAP